MSAPSAGTPVVSKGAGRSPHVVTLDGERLGHAWRVRGTTTFRVFDSWGDEVHTVDSLDDAVAFLVRHR